MSRSGGRGRPGGSGIHEERPAAFLVRECRGARGCRNAVAVDPVFAWSLRDALDAGGFAVDEEVPAAGGLPGRHGGGTPRLALAWCPNGCTMPAVADIGVVVRRPPVGNGESCTGCGACLAVCAEAALSVAPGKVPAVNRDRCVACGQCMRACPAGALAAPEVEILLLLGGRLGRRPRLGDPHPRPLSREEAARLVEQVARMMAAAGMRRLADLAMARCPSESPAASVSSPG